MKAKTINQRGGALHLTAGPSPKGAGGAPAIDHGEAAATFQGRNMKPAKRPKLHREINWAYFDPIAKEFACRRCPERKALERGAESGPINAEDFLEQMVAFESAHAKCRAAGHAEPSPASGRRAS